MAKGTLTINRKAIQNPSGCYNDDFWPMQVNNQTDKTAKVYTQQDGLGDLAGTVDPGKKGFFEFGASVSIP